MQKSQLFIFFCVLLCLNLPFIVCDFYYANSGNCVDQAVDGFSFTLSVWLRVQGALRVVMVGLMLIAALLACCKEETGMKFLVVFFCFVIFYSIFILAWLIAGSVLFWGNLDKGDTCSGPVTGYMYALLILGFLNVCLNCGASFKQKQNNQ